MISGGDDPLIELLNLHPCDGAAFPSTAASLGAPPSAWRAVNAEARANIAKLMHVRGQRLAVMESRPPPAHWVVLSATGSFT